MKTGKSFVTGDFHGKPNRLSGKNWPEGRLLTLDDVVINVGDFSLLWNGDKDEKYWLKWLSERPWTTLFICGNHENFDMLDALPTEERYGADVGVVCDNIFHLRRGRVYTINGKKIFTFGGGLSTDKACRIEGKSWWAREYPSVEELDLAWKNIMKHETVDYVISHVPPEHILDYYLSVSHHSKFDNDLVGQHLRDMSQVLNFDMWLHGHMHVDVQLHPKYVCLYNKILKLGEGIDEA